ncbi:MAG: Zinc uptake regulation protein [Alphaproteobacteria bacterium MarineAlpha9_Bin4]|nr:hypothetical protein [Pelagibacterales bacterium]PPR25249.1 MAG: Zinc uptake regulation protein [Alphaproteobacteria bacterium MarineAlpha9_Bin4]|tara:strand:+ start:1572 stop:2006 length:435 start_codon:yes stop_codon:yes gene_type:complete
MRSIKFETLLNYCVKSQKSLTPTRLMVYRTLDKNNKPISAYDIRNDINLHNKKDINISTIYRVLEFWIKLGLVHKISSLNKFLLCLEPKEKHIHMLNFCTKCEKVIETCNKVMGLNFTKVSLKLKFSVNTEKSIEIPVLCSDCK